MRTDADGSPSALASLLLAAFLFMPGARAIADLRITEGTNLSVDVSPDDGSISIDLLGSLWQVSARGGDAKRLTDGLLPARRPRWAPAGDAILYQADAPPGPQLWRYDLASGVSTRLGREDSVEQHGDWHPDGQRIVFVADRNASGLDVWERDLATGVDWRISSHPGDESSPVWSSNGRHLAYVLQNDDGWHLMLRRFGQTPTALVTSQSALYAPSWRPDGTLLTYLQTDHDRLILRMLILSDPPIERTLARGEDYFTAAVSWKDRDRLYYAADGTIKTRTFGERQSRRVRFSAAIEQPEGRATDVDRQRALPEAAVPGGDLIVRAARLYDGDGPRYRQDVDILVSGGRIEGIEEQRNRGDRFVLDIGDVTVMPGLIDVYSPMPAGDAAAGARILSFGVTTLVTPDAPEDFDASAWDTEATPGPRLYRAADAADKPATRVEPDLRLAILDDRGTPGNGRLSQARAWQDHGVPVLAPNWSVGLSIGADLLLGAAALPASPRGHRYEDVRLASGNGPLTFVTGLADAATPGLDALLQSRQAAGLADAGGMSRRLAGTAPFGQGGATLVVGSRPSALPAGLSTHAELRALKAAGLEPARVLSAATGAAARIIGAEGELGRIVPGARADLLVVSGDPLRDIDDALNVVAVIRNGRFYSLSTLLERAGVE